MFPVYAYFTLHVNSGILSIYIYLVSKNKEQSVTALSIGGSYDVTRGTAVYGWYSWQDKSV